MKADDPEQRFKNALIYGTSHPEIYMTKADELWEKYEKSDWYGDCVHRDGFLAALTEYGEYVRAEAVKNSERYKLRYQWLRDRVPDDLYYELGIILEFGDSGEIDGGIDAVIEKMEIK